MRRWSCTVGAVVLSLAAAAAQESLKSGPQPGTLLPAPFDALNINGKVAEGRQHCLICQNALHPAVLVFAKEPSEKSEKPLTDLMANLDNLMQKHQRDALGGFVVFLSPDSRSSVTIGERDATSTEDLLEEATKRNELVDRLKKRTEPLKNVVAAAYPLAGPKGYNINPKADVTVIFFSRLKVIANWSFEEDKMTEKDVGAITKKVDETLEEARKKRKE